LCDSPPSGRKWTAAPPLESAVADRLTVTEDVYQLFVPPLPEALYAVTGGVMSLMLPGETAYVEGVDVGIVNVRPPAGVDCALRIWFVPPLFARITLYVVLGVKPEPSNPSAAALESWNDTSAAERPVTSKLARVPVHAAWTVWESAAVRVSKPTVPRTLAHGLR